MKSNLHDEIKTSVYIAPKLRIVGLNTRAMLCQSRDINNVREDYEDIFGSEDE